MNNMLGIGSTNFWNPITAVIDWVISIFGDVAVYLEAMIYKALFWIWSSVAQVLDCIQVLFQMLVGVVPVVYNSNSLFANSGNLVIDIIMHPFVYGAFIRILIIAFFLLIIFTFIAVIKNEYSSEVSKGSGNSKGAIIGKSLKAFFSFFLIPMVCIVGIIASTYIMRALDYATSPSSTTIISNKLFISSAYGCNRARSDENFYKAMQGITVDGYSINHHIFAAYDKQEDMAEAIDKAFDSAMKISEVNSGYEKISVGDRFGNYIDTSIIGTDYGIERDTYFNTKNASMVFYFYDLSQFNWVVALFSVFFLASILVSITLGAAVRLYELAILFVISPAIISILPLDDGPFKTWKKKFIGKVIMIFAPVVALNLYFILVDTLLEVDMMATINTAINSGMTMVGPGVVILVAGSAGAILLSSIFDLFIVIAGAMVCKEAIKWLGDMIGGEDMTGAGDKLKNDVSNFVKTNAAMAVGAGAAKFAAGKLTDVGKDKLQGMKDKRDNKKAGEGQLTAIEQNEKNKIQDANDQYTEMESKVDKYDSMTDADRATNELGARVFANSSGLGTDTMDELSNDYNTAYQSNIQKGMNHTDASKAAFASLDSEKTKGLDDTQMGHLEYHMHRLNDNRISSMSKDERMHNLGTAKDAQISHIHDTAKQQRKAVVSGNGEDESLVEINQMIENAPKIAQQAAQQYEADRQVAMNTMSKSDFKAWEKAHEEDKYGGAENHELLKKIEKGEKKARGIEKSKEFNEKFKKSMSEALANAKTEKEKNKNKKP